ncbi:MAG: glutamate--tRNA ligase [Acidimicrobiia bacterium]
MSVRVRFAPSPTGYLHVGGGRTALYNWLYARHHGGAFILRSDDTDAERSTDEFRADILDSLRWLGLDWDEGIEVGGSHGTYRQSDRFDRYREVAEGFVASGDAYYDGATSDELKLIRDEATASGSSPVYDGRHQLSIDAAQQRVVAGDPPPIRFAVPRPGETRFEDAVRGEVVFDNANVDDFVILRSDGSPTYHLASTVDDVDYGITHVMRGEDILSSTPKHILVTEAMGAGRPTYAHLSLLNGPDGKKLSKRHGDTAIRAYRDAGFLPPAVVNFLAILGWSPGDDEEIVSLEDMVERFELGSVSKNPAVFDTTKLEWMNGVYIRQMSPEAFATDLGSLVAEDLGRDLSEAEIQSLVDLAPLVQERAKLLTEVAPQVRFLFVDDLEYDEASWDKVMATPEALVALEGAQAALIDCEWSSEGVEAALRTMLDEQGLSARKGLQPLRVALTGSSVSPPLFESIVAVGRDRALERFAAAKNRLG